MPSPRLPSANGVLPSKTTGYKPTGAGYAAWAFNDVGINRAVWNPNYVEAMLCDSQVALGTMMLCAPLCMGDVEIKADSKVEAYLKEQVETLQGHFAQLLPYVAWGWQGFEILHRAENGILSVGGVKDFHPLDVRPMTREGQLAGVKVTNVPDKDGSSVILRMDHPGKAADGLWLAFQPRYGSLFGISAFRPAFWPWLDKVGRDGAQEIIRQWYYKNAYRGYLVRFPLDEYQDAAGTMRSAKDIAQAMVESLKAGGMPALPSTRDANGQLLWDLENPEMGDNAQGMLDYEAHLNKHIMRGLGLPDDVMEQPDGGGTYGGRRIGWEAFLTHMQQHWGYLVRTMDSQLFRNFVKLNFEKGSDYKIKAASLLDTERKDASGQGGGEAAGLGQSMAGGMPGGGDSAGPGGAGVPLGEPQAPGGGGDPFGGTSGGGAIQFGFGGVGGEAHHAPKGGVTLSGRFFRGGMFIPSQAFEGASQAEKNNFVNAKLSERTDMVQKHLKPHADKHGHITAPKGGATIGGKSFAEGQPMPIDHIRQHAKSDEAGWLKIVDAHSRQKMEAEPQKTALTIDNIHSSHAGHAHKMAKKHIERLRGVLGQVQAGKLHPKEAKQHIMRAHKEHVEALRNDLGKRAHVIKSHMEKEHGDDAAAFGNWHEERNYLKDHLGSVVGASADLAKAVHEAAISAHQSGGKVGDHEAFNLRTAGKQLREESARLPKALRTSHSDYERKISDGIENRDNEWKEEAEELLDDRHRFDEDDHVEMARDNNKYLAEHGNPYRTWQHPEDGEWETVHHEDMGEHKEKWHADGSHTIDPTAKKLAFDETKHPRGQPKNAGEFARSGSSSASLPGAMHSHNEALPDESRSALSKMSRQEAETLKEYSWHAFDDVNKALRGEAESTLDVQKHIDNLTALMDKTPEFRKPVTVYRAVKGSRMQGGGKAFVESLAAAAKSGEPISYRGFASTTTTSSTAVNMAAEFAHGVVFEIAARKGIDMKPYSQVPKENELLLPEGSRLRVTSVDRVNDPDTQEDYYHVKAEHVL